MRCRPPDVVRRERDEERDRERGAKEYEGGEDYRHVLAHRPPGLVRARGVGDINVIQNPDVTYIAA